MSLRTHVFKTQWQWSEGWLQYCLPGWICVSLNLEPLKENYNIWIRWKFQNLRKNRNILSYSKSIFRSEFYQKFSPIRVLKKFLYKGYIINKMFTISLTAYQKKLIRMQNQIKPLKGMQRSWRSFSNSNNEISDGFCCCQSIFRK